MPSSSIQPITDAVLTESIQQAKRRVFIIAPGVWPPVAKAIAEAWRRLDPDQVGVILDIDPEVCRFGYGSLEGIEILQAAAMAANQLIAQETGVRICVFIIDDQTIVFSPTPRQIEAPPDVGPPPPPPPEGSGDLFPPGPGDGEGSVPPASRPPLTPAPPKANGIILGPPPGTLESDIGGGPEGNAGRTIGMDNIDEGKLRELKEDLDKNPPKNFDLARAVSVYNSKLHFVELEVAGCKLSQHKARLPRDLVHVLKKNPQLETKIENSIKLLDASDDLIAGPGLSEEKVFNERDRIQEEFLRLVEKVGTVIERARTREFEAEIEKLKRLVDDFAEGIEAKLVERFEKMAREIAVELRDEVQKDPPAKWRGKLGPNPNPHRTQSFIEEELLKAFGTPAKKVGKMKVSLVYKDVTYDMLKDLDFQKQMEAFFPDLPPMIEYRAAREREQKATTETEK